ncbi:dead end protein 1-like isoform X1 [Phycodurus eques]|uniref:dead end protein 1-like isoform X1 n=1 Tax=Phycodurus eques TaxID=693459 RepID=UPI002ACD8B7F|nr:dead end protein 1-like isoform X1 [Phycodurus eques]
MSSANKRSCLDSTIAYTTSSRGTMESNPSQVLNSERLQALEKWLKTTNTKVTQVNGQRKYGGPPEEWIGPPPGYNCEVYIKHIPRDCYEDLLIPLFSSVGPLWEFRLMMNFSGQNRGFAYAKYGSADVAKNAIHQLHGQMLEPGSHISVYRSTEKRQLVITDLPAFTQQDELLQVLHRLIEGVETLSLKSQRRREGLTAIAVFSSHHAASMAKRVLEEAFQKQYGLSISVRWLSQMKACSNEVQLPRRLQHHPSIPVHLGRAVGVPIAPKSNSRLWSTASPMTTLDKICAEIGIGLPQFDLFYSYACPDGLLCFTYTVCIPRAGAVLQGLVMILPGATAATTLERAHEAAAQQVLQSLNVMQFSTNGI